ncbi:Glycosyltransferase involved in cell wall bisynthesis [Desulfacinum hydrothermale DSM 13146]|uniref:Glycosyltransferase involved in cell wall bisynthesis n=1 Tax=Desulfacinum hydrothermale DSM 13146 TaxID=1121390 RepID=A0A1W1X135_9BACT|nr:glycosyltransferase family 4 protein [Desulfacinum hydrothermale]SMC17676.1 Glycosyltransferase involved in cell wall bisynthesis [Desulfacinum hydrothermale DSM 13146]
MRIVHIETGRHLYGGARQVLILLEGLAQHGFQNTLVCPKGSAIARAATAFARVAPLEMKGEVDPRVPVQLHRIIRKTRPDLIHVHSRRGADWWGGMIACMLAVPAVVTRRVDNPENRHLAQIKYAFYDRIISISRAIYQVLEKAGVAASKLRCVKSCMIPNPAVEAYSKPFFLQEAGLPQDSRLIGTIAQLIPRKGHVFLLRAAQSVVRIHPEARFCLFGRGPMIHDLKELAARLGISENMRFFGFREDLPRILPNLDMVVHPATMEGLGVCLLEASAAGIPIVASPAGGIPEIVQDGRNGFLVDPKDLEALSEKIVWILEHPLDAQRMGSQGRAIVREHFSPEAMVRGNISVYNELLNH